MTERKPPGLSFTSWIDQQISEASERGAFDDLPGAGRRRQVRVVPAGGKGRLGADNPGFDAIVHERALQLCIAAGADMTPPASEARAAPARESSMTAYTKVSAFDR